MQFLAAVMCGCMFDEWSHLRFVATREIVYSCSDHSESLPYMADCIQLCRGRENKPSKLNNKSTSLFFSLHLPPSSPPEHYERCLPDGPPQAWLRLTRCDSSTPLSGYRH